MHRCHLFLKKYIYLSIRIYHFLPLMRCGCVLVSGVRCQSVPLTVIMCKSPPFWHLCYRQGIWGEKAQGGLASFKGYTCNRRFGCTYFVIPVSLCLLLLSPTPSLLAMQRRSWSSVWNGLPPIPPLASNNCWNSLACWSTPWCFGRTIF